MAKNEESFDEADGLLADMEGIEAVHEGRKLAAERSKRQDEKKAASPTKDAAVR